MSSTGPARTSLLEIVRQAAEGTVPLPRPLQATINVTSRCNSRCVYCSYGNPLYSHAPDPSLSTLTTVIQDLGKFGVRSLSFSGGEPLLRDDLADLVRVAALARMTVTLVTNGSLLNLSRAQQLNDSGLTNLVLSLDTLDAGLYERIRNVPFKKTMSAFEDLQAFRLCHQCIPRVVVNMVLTRANCSSLLDSLAALRPLLLPGDTVMIQGYQPPPGVPAAADPLRFGGADRTWLEALCRTLSSRRADGWPIGNSTHFLELLPGFLAASLDFHGKPFT